MPNLRNGHLCTLCGMYHDKVWHTQFGDYCLVCFNDPPDIAIRLVCNGDGHIAFEMKTIQPKN